MRRRSFIAGLPLVTAGALSMQAADAFARPSASGGDMGMDKPMPKFQPAALKDSSALTFMRETGLRVRASPADPRRWAARAQRERRIRLPL